MEAGKKSNVILWACLAAAATGIVAVAAIAAWRDRAPNARQVTTRLRDIHDVLADCYEKINEIEAHLPQAINVSAEEHSAGPGSGRVATLKRPGWTNGNPVLDS